jgi:hypothetical protein
MVFDGPHRRKARGLAANGFQQRRRDQMRVTVDDHVEPP